MGLIDRFQALFRPREQNQLPVTMAKMPTGINQVARMFSVERDRRSMVEDSRGMYDDDPRAKGSIETLSRDAVKNGYQLRIEGPRADEALELADELTQRLDLVTRLDDWCRLTLRDGDSFLELGATATGDIVSVSRKPTLEIRRWSDQYDQFYDPMKAFYWSDQTWSSTPTDNAVFFAEWQMIHARWSRDEGGRYGKPLFASARIAYKRMTQGEFDISIRRKTRSGMRYWHILEEGGPAQVEQYMVMNKDALNNENIAVADFFSSGKTRIEQFQGDTRLAEIDDILHHADTFAVASPVPLELIGYGRDINRDVLEQKKEQYDDSLQAMRQWVDTEMLKPLIERQWLLKGIWPAGLNWSIEWKQKKAPTAVDLSNLAKAMVTLQATGMVTDKTLLRMLAMAMPDFDVQAELDALAAQRPDEIERMAMVADDA